MNLVELLVLGVISLLTGAILGSFSKKYVWIPISICLVVIGFVCLGMGVYMWYFG